MKCEGFDPTRGEHIEVRFNGVISGVDSLLSTPSDSGVYISSGWIDLQVNGFGGVDYNSPASQPEAISQSIHKQFATGVARLFPTVITGSLEGMSAALANLARCRESLPEGRAMEAFHIEGPYISPEDGPRGAHRREWVRKPDYDEFRRLQDAAAGNIRLVTLAPEWPGAAHFIEQAVGAGIVVSIGHTKASGAEIADAVAAGATMSTHLGNAAEAQLRKFPNYLWDQLGNDRLAASFIVDGVHLDPAFLKVALRAKAVERSILVTDAVMPAGCAPGNYHLGKIAVELLGDGSVRLKGGDRLAGSALQMHEAVGNVIDGDQVSLRDALTMATRNPARVARIPGRKRGLNAGERSDIVLFTIHNKRIQVEETWLDGKLVYQKS